MRLSLRMEKAEKLAYNMQSKKDFDWLIKELSKLKFLDCPLANLYISDLLFTREFPAKTAADQHIQDCPICYLISLVILANKEDWTLDELRKEYLKFIAEKNY